MCLRIVSVSLQGQNGAPAAFHREQTVGIALRPLPAPESEAARQAGRPALPSRRLEQFLPAGRDMQTPYRLRPAVKKALGSWVHLRDERAAAIFVDAPAGSAVG